MEGWPRSFCLSAVPCPVITSSHAAPILTKSPSEAAQVTDGSVNLFLLHSVMKWETKRTHSFGEGYVMGGQLWPHTQETRKRPLSVLLTHCPLVPPDVEPKWFLRSPILNISPLQNIRGKTNQFGSSEWTLNRAFSSRGFRGFPTQALKFPKTTQVWPCVKIKNVH